MKKVLCFLVVCIVIFAFSACAAQKIAPSSEAAAESQTENETATADTAPADTASAEAATPPVPEGVESYNILLMGSSEADFTQENDNPYALTHILITIDPQNQILKFTTFPYNLMVDAKTENGSETGQLQFVCNALGPDETVAVLEDNFGIDIDYWILMNMSGVSNTVDALGGVDIDIEDLSLNDIADYVESVVSQAWVDITQTGLQTLSGMQTAGYFLNTMYDNPTAQEEETRFREHHSHIINAVVNAIRLLELESTDLISIAENMKDDYTTNIPDEKWQSIADSSIYCVGIDPEFLHIPQNVEISETGEWDILYDHESDVAAVQGFIGQ